MAASSLPLPLFSEGLVPSNRENVHEFRFEKFSNNMGDVNETQCLQFAYFPYQNESTFHLSALAEFSRPISTSEINRYLQICIIVLWIPVLGFRKDRLV